MCRAFFLSPSGHFTVNAHVRDWGHAETVRRRCPRAVGGSAIRVECTDPGRHAGESASSLDPLAERVGVRAV